MSNDIVVFNNVTVKFGDFTALQNINFSIEDYPDKGEFTAIIGNSGCGKSTILNLIAGFLKPTKGEVFVQNVPVDSPGRDRGMIFQKYSSFPHLNVHGNILFGLKINEESNKLSSGEQRDLVREMIERVGLNGHENKYPHQLSGGQQQRVALARTMVLKPRIILMDEPFSALDEPTRIDMQRLTVELWYKTQATIFIITHSMTEAVYLSERILLMTKCPGQIAYDIRDCLIPTVDEDPLKIQESLPFKKAVEAVRDLFRNVVKLDHNHFKNLP